MIMEERGKVSFRLACKETLNNSSFSSWFDEASLWGGPGMLQLDHEIVVCLGGVPGGLRGALGGPLSGWLPPIRISRPVPLRFVLFHRLKDIGCQRLFRKRSPTVSPVSVEDRVSGVHESTQVAECCRTKFFQWKCGRTGF